MLFGISFCKRRPIRRRRRRSALWPAAAVLASLGLILALLLAPQWLLVALVLILSLAVVLLLTLPVK
ncbi:MAG: hypothetical protein IKS43_05105 [Clostridia bacterium]|nr:hypothetical protein [Clostridia bacterium]